jgi:hypothetical protein
MELGRFERLMSRCTTADRRHPEYPRLQEDEEFRFGESIFVLDRNPIWMTLFLPRGSVLILDRNPVWTTLFFPQASEGQLVLHGLLPVDLTYQ